MIARVGSSSTDATGRARATRSESFVFADEELAVCMIDEIGGSFDYFVFYGIGPRRSMLMVLMHIPKGVSSIIINVK